MRKAAGAGHKLSNAIVTQQRAVTAAGALVNSFGAYNLQGEKFVKEFSQVANTEGTCVTLEYLAVNGLPAEVLTRKRRSSRPLNIADAGKAKCEVEKMPQRDPEGGPMYRVLFKGRTVTVTSGLAAARRLAERFEKEPRW